MWNKRLWSVALFQVSFSILLSNRVGSPQFRYRVPFGPKTTNHLSLLYDMLWPRGARGLCLVFSLIVHSFKNEYAQTRSLNREGLSAWLPLACTGYEIFEWLSDLPNPIISSICGYLFLRPGVLPIPLRLESSVLLKRKDISLILFGFGDLE